MKGKTGLEDFTQSYFHKKKLFLGMGLINPDVELGNEDDNIFKPERRFPDAFNTFVN